MGKLLSKSQLHDYQLAALDHILNNPKSGLFLDMGLGKTATTLTAIKYLVYEEMECDKVLIIAPKRVAESVWDAEINKWEHLKCLRISKVIGTEKQRLTALKAKADIYIIGRDNVVWLTSQYGGSMLPFDWVVIDELSSFKNHQSMRFKALKKAIPSVQRVTGLTGTPAPNGYIDLWAQIYLLDRGERLEKTITAYRERFFTKNYSGWGYDIKDYSTEAINKKIKDICISMKKEDYLDMPQAIINDIYIHFTPKLKEEYKKFAGVAVLDYLASLQETGQEITALNAAGLRSKLLQFANGAVYDSEKNVHEVHDMKLQALEEVIEEANGKPVLVAWSFQHDRDRILKKFKNAVQLKTDQHIKDWNAGKIPIMLMHPASGGHGLNLQAGGHIIAWYGLNDSLELYEQFNARLDRQGQTDTVIINRLIISDTEDIFVADNLSKKTKTQAGLMAAVKALIDKYKKNFKKY